MADQQVVQYPTGHVVAFPASMSADELSDAAGKVWNQFKDAMPQGVRDIGQGVSDAVRGTYQTITAPPQDTTEAAVSAISPGALPLYRTLKSLGHTAKEATQIVGAIHDINQSADPVGTYATVAQKTAAQGAAQALLAIAGDSVVPDADAAVTDEAPVEVVDAPQPADIKVPAPTKPIPAVDADARVALSRINRSGMADDVDVTPLKEAPKGKVIPEDEVNESADNFVRAHTADLKSSVSKGKSIDVHHIEATDPVTNEPLGKMTLTEEPDTGVTRVNGVQSNLRSGSGLGTRMYRQAIHDAVTRGQKEFVSDGVVSPSAQGVWKNLKDAGYPVEETVGKGGKTFSIDLGRLRPKSDSPSLDVTDEMNDSLGSKLATAAKAGSTLGAVIVGSKLGKAESIPDIDKPKTFHITSLPSTPVSDKDQSTIRDIVAEAAPNILPNNIVVLPSKNFQQLAFQAEHGTFGHSVVSNARGSEEHFASMGGTNIKDAFSLVQAGQMYIDSALLKNPNRLRDILTHELGHFQVGGGTEKQADAVKDKVLNPRAKAMQKLLSDVQNLPSNTRSAPELRSTT